ncbi:MAG TPA: HAD family hydrolase [Dermatophilaceae bacterium]|nr:HAD family hydrolase [Dermatophilaceae bacterium]
MIDTAVFDVDGTLVDTNYHHVLAWAAAFGSVGQVVPCWWIHHHVGMGGDKLVAAVAGEEVERQHGDDVRAAWEHEFDQLIDSVCAFEAARDLVAEVRRRGFRIVLSSSGKRKHVERFLEIARVGDLADVWTTADDAQESKPSPDLLQIALERAGARGGVMVGDSPYDAEAAGKLGMPAIGVLCGGFGEHRLRAAGAETVVPSLAHLLQRLDETRLAAPA